MNSDNQAESKAFTGISGSTTLPDLIRMECSVKATRAVRIDCGGAKGRIFFARGQVIHAETGELSGESAIAEMLRWTSGEIVVADGVLPAQETIFRPWQSLLLDAKRSEREPVAIKPRLVASRRRR